MGVFFDQFLQVNVIKGNSGPVYLGDDKRKATLKSKGDLLIQQAKAEKEQARMLPNEQFNYPQIEE